MTKTRYQVFFDEDLCAAVDRLAKQFGWTPSQVLERTLRFFLKVQKHVGQYGFGYHGEVENFDENNPDSWPIVYRKHPDGQVDVCEETYLDYIHLLESLKEGLAPMDGFQRDEE